MSKFLSNGAQQMLSVLSNSGYFPHGKSSRIDCRVGKGECIPTWFKRVADSLGDLESFSLEEHIACLGVVKKEDNHIQYFNVQAVVTTSGTIDDLYLDADGVEYSYFRLELDLTKPGPLFKEPLPHMHVVPDGAPRFPFQPRLEKSVFADFLEFIYLNFAHDIWLEWATRIWKKRTAYSIDNDPLERMIAAYKTDGQWKLLCCELQNGLGRFKGLLMAEKKEICRDFAPITPNAHLMSYN